MTRSSDVAKLCFVTGEVVVKNPRLPNPLRCIEDYPNGFVSFLQLVQSKSTLNEEFVFLWVALVALLRKLLGIVPALQV